MFVKKDKNQKISPTNRLTGSIVIFISPIIPCVTLLKNEPVISVLLIVVFSGVAICLYTGKGMFKNKE
jgi:hypothetical protein